MINLYNEEVSFPLLGQRRQLKHYIKDLITNEKKRVGEINIIFCSDQYLLAINREHLQHDYFTDVITFDRSEFPTLHGDIFISIDTVRTNASTYQVSFELELYRVVFHGILHMCGYQDKSPDQQKLMREKEDQYLNLLLPSSSH